MTSIDGSSDTVGFRFHPTDKELVDHYLWNKILDRDSLVQAINEVDGLFNKDPWGLPCCSKIKSADRVWYFFSRRGDNKRMNRTTGNGFWKVTGKARNVKGKKGNATKKTLVFYEGRASNAKWTPWVIHEYTFTSTVVDNKEGIFLCKLKNKEEEKADASSSECCQPSLVSNDETPESSTMFSPDEMIDALEQPGARDEVENNFSLAEQPLMHKDQVPSCEEFTHSYDFGGSYDGVQHLSISNELEDDSWINCLVDDDDEFYHDERSNGQDVENEGCNLLSVDTSTTCPGESYSSRKRSRFEGGALYRAVENEGCLATSSTMFNLDEMLDALEQPNVRDEVENNFSLAKQSLIHEDQVPCEDFTHSYDLGGSYDGVQHLSISNEAEEDSWVRYLVDDDEFYHDERSNEQDVENEGCNLPSIDMSMTCPGESSRKRSRFENSAM